MGIPFGYLVDKRSEYSEKAFIIIDFYFSNRWFGD